MIINTVKINNSKLTPGKYYQFEVIKTFELDKNEKYFVLKDPLGYKVLLPYEHYANYGLKPGEKKSCRVDKINCKGKMFLEPEHPFYKEGKIYPFRFVESKERTNFYDEKEYIIVVSDIFENKWDVKTSPGNNRTDSQQVDCYVDKIKKGKLFLHKAGDESTPHRLVPGDYQEFVIINEKTNPENKKRFFILADKNNNKHLLEKRFYLNYRLKPGRKITCRVDRLSSEGYYYLEPLHPYYKIEKIYKFPVKRVDKLEFSNNKHQYILILEDIFGDEIKVDLGENIESLPNNKEFMEFKIKDFHRGKPVLTFT